MHPLCLELIYLSGFIGTPALPKYYNFLNIHAIFIVYAIAQHSCAIFIDVVFSAWNPFPSSST